MKVWLTITYLLSNDEEWNQYFVMKDIKEVRDIESKLVKRYGENYQVLYSPDEKPVGYRFTHINCDILVYVYTKPVKKVMYYDERALNVLTGESIDIAPVQVATYYSYELWEKL